MNVMEIMNFADTAKRYKKIVIDLEDKKYKESEWFLDYFVESIWKQFPTISSFSISPGPFGCRLMLKTKLDMLKMKLEADRRNESTVQKLKVELSKVHEKYPLFAKQASDEIVAELSELHDQIGGYNEAASALELIPIKHIQRKFGDFEYVTFYKDKNKEPNVQT